MAGYFQYRWENNKQGGRLKHLLAGILIGTFTVAHAQISSPGLGTRLNSSAWMAIGLREDLDTSGDMRLLTYFGIGRQSKPVGFNPFEHPAIIVVNQEFYRKFSDHLQYSVALSYRRQNEYGESMSYSASDPLYKNEIRLYGRFIFFQRIRRAKYTAIARQELRRFYAPGMKDWEEDIQLRTRLKLQQSLNLSPDKVHTLTWGAECLFKYSHHTATGQWSGFKYDETRLTAFYVYAPQHSAWVYSVGYMNNIIGRSDMSYFMFGVLVKDPFSKLKRKLTRDKQEIY